MVAASRAPRSLRAWWVLSGLGRVRSSSRVWGVEEHYVLTWMGMLARRLPRSRRRVTNVAEGDLANAGDGAIDLQRHALLTPMVAYLPEGLRQALGPDDALGG